VEREFEDLVPVFVEEARHRVDHLASVAPRVSADGEAEAVAKRELHTLKGSARMLGLGGLAALCHAAEDAVAARHPRLADLLTRVTDRLAAMLDAVAAGGDPAADDELLAALGEGLPAPASRREAKPEPAAEPEGAAADGAGGEGEPDAAGPAAPELATEPGTPGPAAAAATAGDFRVDAAALDQVADRATQLRLMALAAARVGDRMYELAQLAEDGLQEPQPKQVLAVLSSMLRRMAVEIEGDQRLMLRAADEQLERVLSLQLQPLRGPLLSVARYARQLAASLGKEVDVDLGGQETRLDRRITRDLEDSLIHLVRNAVDHGLETPAERRRAGKPAAGRLAIAAAASGSRVQLSIADDGPGIDVAAVARRAVEAGLVEPAAAAKLSRDEAHRLLFAPGFTTRTEVSELSGRGVGLDVVAAAVTRVGGEVTIESEPGRGTRVELRVPMARRGEQVMVVRVGEARLAVPSAAVRGVSELAAAAVVERDGRFLARRDGRLVPFLPLARHLGESGGETQLLLEGSAGGQSMAVAVDAVLGEEEVLVRAVPRVVGGDGLLEGVALLASGHPVGVLSPAALGRRDLLARHRPAARPAPALRRVRVLLVDDSLVTREMERRLLEDAGFAVTVAGDADEALSHLGEEPFDCIVTDIEMPGMDGFQLTERLRSMEHFAELPIVVVSTRDRPEDRLRGLTAGADAYLTKQGLNAGELVDLVRRLAGR
jgi:two-component system, chemotaxis family, sensor kinase CheA